MSRRPFPVDSGRPPPSPGALRDPSVPRSTGAFKPPRRPVLSSKDVRSVATCGRVSSFHVPARALSVRPVSSRRFQQNSKHFPCRIHRQSTPCPSILGPRSSGHQVGPRAGGWSRSLRGWPGGGKGSLPRAPSLGSPQGALGQECRVSGPFGFCAPSPTPLHGPDPQTQPSPACIRMPAARPAGTSGPTKHAGARWWRCLHGPPFPAVSRNQRGKGPEPILGLLAAISHTRSSQEESAQPDAGGGGGGEVSPLNCGGCELSPPAIADPAAACCVL